MKPYKSKGPISPSKLLVLQFLLLLVVEFLRPLRNPTEARGPRILRNFVIAGLGSITMIFVQKPLVDALYRKMDKKNWGVVRSMRLPRWASTIASILLLDYSLYLWHVLTHRLPLLWRFHQVHHIDKDLDASTALRFHFGELLLSVPWRLLQICLIGPSRKSFQLWQSLLMSSVLFHHSNIRLAPRIERLVAWLIMTPSLHGIHHSQRKDEMDTNWSSGLTLWDRLHGTFKGKSLKAEVDIGVEGYSGPHTLIPVLRLPFSKKHKVGA